MKLLFITRKYPPMVGGMEKLSFGLAKEFSRQTDTTLITWGKSQKFLPLILVLFFFKALYIIPTKKITHIHIGDALLSPLGLLLKTLFRVKTTVTVAGLDITWNFPGYQLLVPWCVKRLDKVFCISHATLEECVKRGIPREKCVYIPCGIFPELFYKKATRKNLEEIVGVSLTNKRVLITVGRLVSRKGVLWFIKNVMPELDKNNIYLVIGDGPNRAEILTTINSLDLKDRVLLLGKVSDEKLKTIYNTADLFIMPNLSVKHNIEGFGIVAIEASSVGLPVIASDIEGIRDAVTSNKNGLLVEEENPAVWISTLNKFRLKDMLKTTIASWTKQNFKWDIIANKYLKEFYEIK